MGTPPTTYSRTHPWINFGLDVRLAGAEFWMLLGEARSKTEHLEGSLLRPEVAAEMNRVFLAKGVHATTAIEGNTLSEADAQRVIDGTLTLPPSQEYLAREVQNVVTASTASRTISLRVDPRLSTSR